MKNHKEKVFEFERKMIPFNEKSIISFPRSQGRSVKAYHEFIVRMTRMKKRERFMIIGGEKVITFEVVKVVSLADKENDLESQNEIFKNP